MTYIFGRFKPRSETLGDNIREIEAIAPQGFPIPILKLKLRLGVNDTWELLAIAFPIRMGA
jgi:hypothetical protein